MRRALLLATIALVLGIGSGEYLTTNFSFRRWLGDVVRRGNLQALVERRGIYDADVERAWRGELFAAGADAQDIETSAATWQKRAALQRLIEQEELNAAVSGQAINSASVAHQMDLLRAQFRDEKTWNSTLAGAALTRHALQREISTNLRDRNWLEAQIAARIQPNEAEVRRYYDEHRSAFQEPLRLRASHLFLAAPEGYPAEVIAVKRSLIEELSKRLADGESFPALVAEFSEDDATKKRGGDLGYFASERMLPVVFAAAQRLRPGESSAPVRSRLGFHIIRLTESRPARALTFEEARPEIEALLANLKRAAAIATLVTAMR
jgi:peptidyl-prolyl cis-trans isomerase C